MGSINVGHQWMQYNLNVIVMLQPWLFELCYFHKIWFTTLLVASVSTEINCCFIDSLDKIFCQVFFLFLLPMSFRNYNVIQNVALDSQQFLVCSPQIALRQLKRDDSTSSVSKSSKPPNDSLMAQVCLLILWFFISSHLFKFNLQHFYMLLSFNPIQLIRFCPCTSRRYSSNPVVTDSVVGDDWLHFEVTKLNLL